jgi:prepilin-type N-terminal cleavage/methylation domain-containing protein
MKLPRGRSGYTLMELIVVVLIIGILAAYGVPQYLRTVETTKADDAVAMVNMIGTTNKMFALDHGGSYVNSASAFPANCAGAACPAAGPYTTPCALVGCKYLADQAFSSKAYDFFACDGAVNGDCGGNGASGNNVSGAKRKAAGSSAPYNTWGFTMNTSGTITAYGTTPITPTY